MQSKIDIIYSHKDKLKELLSVSFDSVFFSGIESYIGIKKKYGKQEVTIIFIDKGIWQYVYFNSAPRDKKYISAETFINHIVEAIKKATE